jgi:hypothetical protein
VNQSTENEGLEGRDGRSAGKVEKHELIQEGCADNKLETKGKHT